MILLPPGRDKLCDNYLSCSFHGKFNYKFEYFNVEINFKIIFTIKFKVESIIHLKQKTKVKDVQWFWVILKKLLLTNLIFNSFSFKFVDFCTLPDN
jgi:hypothetical protein